MAVPRVCSEPGCPLLVTGSSRCEEHTVKRPHNWTSHPSPAAARRRRGAAWMSTRRAVMKRDRYTCWVCGGTATEVDHRVSLANGGTDSLANLAAICHPCHVTKTRAERSPR